jgi:hypothetical protein
MPGELFGAPNGFIASADQEDKRARLFSDLAHQAATTNMVSQEAATIQRSRENNDKMMQMLAGMATEPQVDTTDPNAPAKPISQGDLLTKMGTRLLQSGFFVQGGHLLQQGEMINSRLATQKHNLGQAALEAQKLKINAAKDLNNILAGVDTSSPDAPQQWANGLSVYAQQHPDDAIPPYLMNYNPGVAELLKRTTETGIKLMGNEHKQANEELRLQSIQAAADRQADRLDWRTELERYKQDQINQRAKAGAGKQAQVPVIGSPPRDMINSAQSLLDEAYPGLPADMKLGKDAVVSSAAYDLASEARALMGRNRGLSASQAMQQVFTQMDKAGVFQATPRVDPMEIAGITIPGTGSPAKAAYNRRGALGTAGANEVAVAPPKDPTQLQDGKLYSLPQGKFYYNKATKKFTSTRPAAAARSAPVTEPDLESE